MCAEPGAVVLPLFELAQQSDAGYGDVYLERANFHLRQKDFNGALPDLQQAQKLTQNSALVELGFAEAYLLQGNLQRSLNAAERAYKIDKTLLPAYYYLGLTYNGTGAYEKAIEPLQIYLLYETEDANAYALLGEALAKTGDDYRDAVEALNQALRLDRTQVSAYLYLGTSYLRLNNLAGAEVNLRRAIEFFPNSFDANIGLTEIFYKNGTYGSSYLQAETSLSKADTDRERALSLYWRALSHEGRKSWSEAITDWNLLLGMPSSAMTPEMRTEAREHLRSIATPTRTPIGPRRQRHAHCLGDTPARQHRHSRQGSDRNEDAVGRALSLSFPHTWPCLSDTGTVPLDSASYIFRSRGRPPRQWSGRTSRRPSHY